MNRVRENFKFLNLVSEFYPYKILIQCSIKYDLYHSKIL